MTSEASIPAYFMTLPDVGVTLDPPAPAEPLQYSTIQILIEKYNSWRPFSGLVSQRDNLTAAAQSRNSHPVCSVIGA